MPIRIDPDEATAVLDAAFLRAEANTRLPTEWIDRVRTVGEATSKTYVAALGTALLARATDERVDPMSIKATPDKRRAYSARTLCHGVLVPASREYGFDLGATGREPLNNQPFFRYERMDEMDRVRDTSGLDALLASVRRVGQLSARDARSALAAFVKVRLDVAAAKQRVDLRGMAVGVRQTLEAVSEFVSEKPEGGKRGQALVAAAFDVAFDDVRMGRVNDPSRRFPGDVQVLEGAQVVLAAEVRQKLVETEDVVAFGATIAAAGVATGVMVALHPRQAPLDRPEILATCEGRFGVLMSGIDSVNELLSQALMWSGARIDDALTEFPERYGDRLDEIEVESGTVARWRAVLAARAR